MSTTLEPSGATTPGSTKPLWVAVGVLGAAVLAMGGTLLYQQVRSTAAPAQPVVALNAPAPAAVTAAAKTAADDPAPTEKPVLAPAKPAQHAAKSVAKPAEKKVVAAAQPAPVPAAPAVGAPAPVARSICANCGTVEAVTAVERKGQGSGVGAVGGAVVGGLLGNQVGKGSGRTAATVLGAIGGGVAGNVIEKNIKKETVYQVQIRMEDGSLRSMEQGAPVAVGTKVTVQGGSLHTADGALIPPAATPKPAAPAAPATSGPGYLPG
ncbi:MAG: glycine zipper 2TM domain-containing protein [Burkholderiaceae bacterium]